MSERPSWSDLPERMAFGVSDGPIMQQGRVALVGTASAVFDHPQIGHRFRGGVVDVGELVLANSLGRECR